MNLTTTFFISCFSCAIISDSFAHHSIQSAPAVETFTQPVSIRTEFSSNGHFYTTSAETVLPESGYYRLSLIDSNGEEMRTNPFSVSDDFTKEAFAFCCNEPDTQEISQTIMTVIDGIAD